MPLYEYKCHQCGKVIEVLQKFSDEPLKIHEDCGGDLERLVSRSAFQLKGTGWYATDYGSKKGSEGKNSDRNGESKSNDSKAGDSKAGESNPAAEVKSETKTAESSGSSGESKPAPSSSSAPSSDSGSKTA